MLLFALLIPSGTMAQDNEQATQTGRPARVQRMTYEQMTDELGRAIKRFAKRQMTWFRGEEGLHWLDMADDPVAQASALIDAFLAG